MPLRALHISIGFFPVFCKNLMVALCSKRLAKGVKAMNKRAKNNNQNMFVCCVLAAVSHSLHFQTVSTVRSSTYIYSKVTWIDQEVNKVDPQTTCQKNPTNPSHQKAEKKNQRGVRFPSYTHNTQTQQFYLLHMTAKGKAQT